MILLEVTIAVTFLYIGGMYLNDAFDVAFDRQHRKSRPIPSGAITEKEVWQWGLTWLILGTVALVCLSKTTAMLTLALVACILVYDAIHKAVAFAPVIMAGCRFFVYLVAASVASNGVTGNAVWCAVALASYIVGLSYLARKESIHVPIQHWSAIFLAAPLVVGWLINDGITSHAASLLSLVLVGWVVWALHFTIGRAHPNIGASVSRLLAGIVLVDLLAVSDQIALWPVLAPCFVLALLLQKFIPAT